MEKTNIDIEYINKMYKYMKHDMNIEDFMTKFHINFNELNGIGVQSARNGFGVYIPVNYNYFEYIELPNNIVNKESYIVYENRIVEKNVINYYGDDIEINIYFSANTLNQELNSTTKECSKIKGQDIKLYKYENVYIAEFNYDNMHYQIKGCNISEKDFIILLKSIIK